MKIKFRLTLAALCILISVCCTGCKYVSSYSATVCIHSSSSDSGSIQFDSLRGTYVFKMQADSASQLSYTAKLGSGRLKVYYDLDDGKKELFSLNSGDTAEASLSPLKAGTLYVIIETEGSCENSDLRFSLKNR